MEPPRSHAWTGIKRIKEAGGYRCEAGRHYDTDAHIKQVINNKRAWLLLLYSFGFQGQGLT
jgi:hypothetical protein